MFYQFLLFGWPFDCFGCLVGCVGRSVGRLCVLVGWVELGWVGVVVLVVWVSWLCCVS